MHRYKRSFHVSERGTFIARAQGEGAIPAEYREGTGLKELPIYILQ
jgi:hypothetical protein